MNMQLSTIPDREVDQNLVRFHEGLSKYLESLGLPSDNILVPVQERREVIGILPNVVGRMTSEQCKNASYISKFTAAVATGLFDAALNYLWDETIRNLRDKVCRYDLQYFYDTAITNPKSRAKFKTESDLQKIQDWNLIHGCQEIGLISELALKHLDFIRDMRNFASAAHPNQNQLTGLQLIQWMDTCIREVLAKEPLAPAIEAQRLLRNLREQELDIKSAKPINQAIVALDSDFLLPLLRTIFGMFVDPDLSTRARGNIRLVQRTIWQGSTKAARHEIGLKYSSFRVHGEADRANLAREFLEKVEGLTYLPESDLELEISDALNALFTTHNGWHNFYYESFMVKKLAKLVPDSGTVPDGIRTQYIKVLTMCKLTNGHGAAWDAEPTYNQLIRTWQDKDILEFLSILSDACIKSRLQFPLCSEKLHEITSVLSNHTSNTLALEGLKFIEDSEPKAAGKAVLASRFTRIVKRVKVVIR